MWSFDPASPEYRQAIDYLKSYGAPEPKLIQHIKPPVDILSTQTSATDALLLNELYYFQEKLTEDAVVQYDGAVHNWMLNLPSDPTLPAPAIPELPGLIPPLNEVLFGRCGIDAPLVVSYPGLALRILRLSRVVPGNWNDYVPFPRAKTQPADDRVIGDESAGTPGYFRPGPADNFPNHYVYTLNGKSYLKLVSPFGAVWMLMNS